MPVLYRLLLIAFWGVADRIVGAFQVNQYYYKRYLQTQARRTITTTFTQLNLIPIRKFRDDFTFLSQSDSYRVCIDSKGRYIDSNNNDKYELCLVEESDLPDVSKFVVECFGADAIRLSNDINAFEKMLMQPAIEMVNGYSSIVAFAEVLAGLRSRLDFRFKSNTIDLSPPNLIGLSHDEQIRMVECTSIVLALAKKHSTTDSQDWHSDVIASIELRLQPCDAKIPFTLPWLDRIERTLGSLVGLGNKSNNGNKDLQPYLSNLCVDDKYRGKGLGKALVRCIENIAQTSWKYKRMYLHVDLDNEPALLLYKNEGYNDVGIRWNPFWAGKAADIGYFVKKLKNSSSTEKNNDKASEKYLGRHPKSNEPRK